MYVRRNNKTNRHLNHRWERFNWTHPCVSACLNVIVNTAKEPEIAKATYKDAKIPIESPFHAWSDRSKEDRFTYNLWHNMEPSWAFFETKCSPYLEKSRTYNPLMIANEIYTELTPENSNPRKLEPRAYSNQSRFPLDFLYPFTVILPSVSRSLDNSNLPLTRSNFVLSFRRGLQIISIQFYPRSLEACHKRVKSWEKNRILKSETLNVSFTFLVQNVVEKAVLNL